MLDFLAIHRRGKSAELESENQPHQPRSSQERPLHPLLSDEGTDESRYYRSADFQQALLDEQIRRTDAPPPEIPEKHARRLSKMPHQLTASKSSASLPLFDFQEEEEEIQQEEQTQEQRTEAPSQATDGAVHPTATGDGPSSESGGSASSEQSRKLNRRRSVLDGIGSLAMFARKKHG